jgi:methionyl-tRNA formyltransferase
MAHRVVFLGTPEFAVPALRELHADPRVDVTLVVTQPDRLAGRGRRLRPSSVKQVALDLGLPLIQPERVNDPDGLSRIQRADPHLIVLVAYGEFLGRALLSLPPHGCLNLHPSLLPRYRGATPVQAAILNGDAETGITIMRMTRKLDAGPILHQRVVPLSGTETAGALAERLAHIGGIDLPNVIDRWIGGEITAVPQDDALATYTPELRKVDAEIDWSRSAIQIERFVRAMDPWPRAWTELGGERLSVLGARIASDGDGRAFGEITLDNERVLVLTGAGWLELVTVQPAGKRAMEASSWARGARIQPGRRFC